MFANLHWIQKIKHYIFLSEHSYSQILFRILSYFRVFRSLWLPIFGEFKSNMRSYIFKFKLRLELLLAREIYWGTVKPP